MASCQSLFENDHADKHVQVDVLPFHAFIINVTFVCLGVFVLLYSAIYKVLYLPGRLRSNYPRFRVRSFNGQLTMIVGLIFATIGGPLYELIGLSTWPCGLSTYLWTLGGCMIVGSVARRANIFVFRVYLSRTKKDLLLDDGPQVRKYRRKLKIRMNLFQLGTFVLSFICLMISFNVRNGELYSAGCVRCEVFDRNDAISFLLCYILMNVISLLPLIMRINRDAFAQMPEYRLMWIIPFPLIYLAFAFHISDPNGLDSSFTLRGVWIGYIAYLIIFIIAIPYQLYLASKEGVLVNPYGTDAISRIVHSIRYKRRVLLSPKRNGSFLSWFSTGSNLELDTFLKASPGNIQLFQEYLVSEYCSELMMFYSSVIGFEQTWDKLNDKERNEKALQVYSTFVKEGAILQVNISHDIRDNIKVQLNNPSQKMFKDAFDDVMQMMRNGAWLRFVAKRQFETKMFLTDNHNSTPANLVAVHNDYNNTSAV